MLTRIPKQVIFAVVDLHAEALDRLVDVDVGVHGVALLMEIVLSG